MVAARGIENEERVVVQCRAGSSNLQAWLADVWKMGARGGRENAATLGLGWDNRVEASLHAECARIPVSRKERLVAKAVCVLPPSPKRGNMTGHLTYPERVVTEFRYQEREVCRCCRTTPIVKNQWR